MDNDNIDDQMKIWVDLYKRFFEDAMDGVDLADDDKIPDAEMKRYVDNYKKWFVDTPKKNELLRKKAALEKIYASKKLYLETLKKIIDTIDRMLSEAK